MPLYDYRCERCSTQFEVRQSFTDDRLTVCPPEGGPPGCTAPGEGPVKKVFTGVSISFKGDGFYKNDYGAYAKARRTERDVAAKSSESSAGSSSSKDSQSESSKSANTGGASSGSGNPGNPGNSGKAKAPAAATRASR